MSPLRESEDPVPSKRALPSYLSSTSSEARCESGKKQQAHSFTNEEAGGSHTRDAPVFSKLLEGVVVVLSGFVNPERATLRSQALQMGAAYRPNWSSDCTLLVCAYSNTPKFRQVVAGDGTVVAKEWISECYNHKQLVEIDRYLMHIGKPWRIGIVSDNDRIDQKESSQKKSKQDGRGSDSKPCDASFKAGVSNLHEQFFLPNVKEWVIGDLNRTISWLEDQEEKPDPSEISKIAAGGILICLQDTIHLLEQAQDIRQVAEQWNVVPRVVEELAKLAADATKNNRSSSPLSMEALCRHAKVYQQIYSVELDELQKKRERERDDGDETIDMEMMEHDSDETIEMTHEEIKPSCHSFSSKSRES